MNRIIIAAATPAGVKLHWRKDEDEWEKRWTMMGSVKFVVGPGVSLKVIGRVGYLLVEEGRVAVAQDDTVFGVDGGGWLELRPEAFVSEWQ